MKTFYHHGQCGDIIYSLPTVKALGGGTLSLGMNETLLNAMIPLLYTQSYIEYVDWSKDSGLPKGYINLDDFRIQAADTKLHLVNCHLRAFGLPDYDFSKPWLEGIKITTEPYAVINVTDRYIDKAFNWRKEVKYLQSKYEDVYFLGLEKEYKNFIDKYKISLTFVPTDDFLVAAKIIGNAMMYTGNQSSLMAIRQGLGLPYRIHKSPYMPNCCQYNEKETIINPISRKIHILGAAIKEVLR